ncbi:Lrp/AsnC family transcriptional regulator [Streptomyces sp. NPDC014870]|uniref:Lrp/AsnC family transcriptional regulator n=1 Tax=Streptomyces sp. NPDC014870 TaxID=3364925 RepID=UPI0036FE7519
MRTGESVLGEADLALIHALQLAPRATWTDLAAVVGTSPDTLARRWEQLTSGGYAWAGLLARYHASALALYAWVEVDCAAGRSEDTAVELARDPQTHSVHQVTGDTDLVLLVTCPDLVALDEYLVRRVQGLPGVIRSRTQVITRMHPLRNGRQLDQLTPQQAHRLTELTGPVAGPGRKPHRFTDADRRIVSALAGDARISAAELARQVGTSESTVRRRLEALATGGALFHHCKPAPRFSGRPVFALVKADVPPLEAASASAAVGRLRQTRLVTSVTGPHNLSAGVWLRSVDELNDVTAAVARAVPGLRITGTVLSLRVHKLGAQVLGPDGRRTHHVRPAGLPSAEG